MTNVSTNPIPTPAISAEARAYLAQALNLDLIGPPANHELAEERIPGWVRPSNWYLTGFLVPTDAPPEQSVDADEEDELDETPATTAQTVTLSAKRFRVRGGNSGAWMKTLAVCLWGMM